MCKNTSVWDANKEKPFLDREIKYSIPRYIKFIKTPNTIVGKNYVPRNK